MCIRDSYKSVKKGALTGIEKSAEATVKVGLVVLVANVAGPLAALAATVLSFQPFAKKAKEIEDDINIDV